MKTIFLDLGGTLVLNKHGQAALNARLFDILKNNRDAFKLVILSDTPYDIEKILNNFKVSETFHPLIITKHLFPINKTDPDTYLFACEKAGASPVDCLLIDNEPDFIKAANDAGIRSINSNNLDTIEQLLRE